MMKKIKITKDEKELEGEIKKGNVTLFGNSAHIPFSKKHLAKKVSVIIPSNPEYIWLLTKLEKKKLINIASKVVKKENGKLEHYRQGLIKDLSGKSFDINSLIKIVDIIESDKKEIKLIKKIKKLYHM
jgi:putative transposon-encoded protein|tara:strand:- start:5978 stop:6361 length:384 start_codon:yes stop_codon:yes gene_type:complete